MSWWFRTISGSQNNGEIMTRHQTTFAYLYDVISRQ